MLRKLFQRKPKRWQPDNSLKGQAWDNQWNRTVRVIRVEKRSVPYWDGITETWLRYHYDRVDGKESQGFFDLGPYGDTLKYDGTIEYRAIPTETVPFERVFPHHLIEYDHNTAEERNRARAIDQESHPMTMLGRSFNGR